MRKILGDDHSPYHSNIHTVRAILCAVRAIAIAHPPSLVYLKTAGLHKALIEYLEQNLYVAVEREIKEFMNDVKWQCNPRRGKRRTETTANYKAKEAEVLERIAYTKARILWVRKYHDLKDAELYCLLDDFRGELAQLKSTAVRHTRQKDKERQAERDLYPRIRHIEAEAKLQVDEEHAEWEQNDNEIDVDEKGNELEHYRVDAETTPAPPGWLTIDDLDLNDALEEKDSLLHVFNSMISDHKALDTLRKSIDKHHKEFGDADVNLVLLANSLKESGIIMRPMALRNRGEWLQCAAIDPFFDLKGFILKIHQHRFCIKRTGHDYFLMNITKPKLFSTYANAEKFIEVAVRNKIADLWICASRPQYQ